MRKLQQTPKRAASRSLLHALAGTACNPPFNTVHTRVWQWRVQHAIPRPQGAHTSLVPAAVDLSSGTSYLFVQGLFSHQFQNEISGFPGHRAEEGSAGKMLQKKTPKNQQHAACGVVPDVVPRRQPAPPSLSADVLILKLASVQRHGLGFTEAPSLHVSRNDFPVSSIYSTNELQSHELIINLICNI